MTLKIDIGLNHTVEPVENSDQGLAGFQVRHLGPDGELCQGGWINVDPEFGSNTPTWTVVQREPLTLKPSLLCRICGDHGFVTNGRWVPA